MWRGGVGALLAAACHAAPTELATSSGEPLDAGVVEGCFGGYVLQSRYLGAAFALQATIVSERNVPLSMAPVLPEPGDAAASVWTFEAEASGGPSAYRISNFGVSIAGLEEMYLANSGEMVPNDSDEPGIWLVEPVAPEFQADVPLFLVRPQSDPNTALQMTPQPPHTVFVESGSSSPTQHWRLTYYQLCDLPL